MNLTCTSNHVSWLRSMLVHHATSQVRQAVIADPACHGSAVALLVLVSMHTAKSYNSDAHVAPVSACTLCAQLVWRLTAALCMLQQLTSCAHGSLGPDQQNPTAASVLSGVQHHRCVSVE